MRIVCISDTHSMHRRIPAIPDGDILIHAGDCLGTGSLEEIEDVDHWLGSLPHRHKILIAGNHDWAFEKEPAAARSLVQNAIYLEDQGTEIEGLYFWGSPWVPWFLDYAFNLQRGEPLKKRWAEIPDHTDVLITHSPPQSVLDEARISSSVQSVGCEDLKNRISALNIQAHIFGHIHEGYGQQESEGIRFINASTCNRRFQPINPPIVFDL